MRIRRLCFPPTRDTLQLKTSDLSFLDEPQTFAMSYAERSVYIIKKILIEHRPLNTFDLCDELFISYSTLKSDGENEHAVSELSRALFDAERSDSDSRLRERQAHPAFNASSGRKRTVGFWIWTR